MKAFYALDMNPEQRMMINSTTDSRNSVVNMAELKRIAINIFDVSEEKLEGDTFQTNDADGDAVSTADYKTEDMACAIQKPRSGKAEPKAGNLERSAQSTKSLFCVVGRVSAEENQRIRRRQYGHWRRDCPMPFDKTVVFPKAKAGKPQKGKMRKGYRSEKGHAKEKGRYSPLEILQRMRRLRG